MNFKGGLQHNFLKEKSEFGAQMCLRSGWLDYLKASIDRVLTHHPLDGVYYDWNVALLCCNPRHEKPKADGTAGGHWDIDELLNLMEWTRRRVGPRGLIIVHNTTTPMFATENFADDVVANEWGYGKWSEKGPSLAELPLEWSLVSARRRGVISYGQLDARAPRRLHRLFALEALLGGGHPMAGQSGDFRDVPGSQTDWRARNLPLCRLAKRGRDDSSSPRRLRYLQPAQRSLAGGWQPRRIETGSAMRAAPGKAAVSSLRHHNRHAASFG
jgi:hypothetical protein